MILTVTPSPFLLRTASVDNLTIGGSNTLENTTAAPSGTGVDIGNVLYIAGLEVKAVFPAPEISQYVRLMHLTGLPHEFLPVPGPVQTLFSLDDAAGNRTTFKEPSRPLDTTQLAMFRDLTISLAEQARWVVLAGPLPDTAPPAWYVEVLRALNLYHPRIKTLITTSGPAFDATIRQLAATCPDVLVVCAEHGESEQQLLADAASYVAAGVQEVLVLPNRERAIVVNSQGSVAAAEYTGTPGNQALRWQDSAVAGFLLSAATSTTSLSEDGARMRAASAVAYANADGSDWGGNMPTRDTINLAEVTVTVSASSTPQA